MKCFVCLTSIYSLIFPLIKIRSSISQHLHNNFCYFHNGLSSSQIMVFISFFVNYNFTLLLVQHSGFNKCIISPCHPEQQLQKKYYKDTWCTYAPLRLHVPYTFSGRGVTMYICINGSFSILMQFSFANISQSISSNQLKQFNMFFLCI